MSELCTGERIRSCELNHQGYSKEKMRENEKRLFENKT